MLLSTPQKVVTLSCTTAAVEQQRPLRLSLYVLRASRVFAVQHQCIPNATMGSDVLCQAKSGMGKTAVFVLSILQQIKVEFDETSKVAKVGALVMAHTRELAFQVSRLHLAYS